MKGSHRAPPKQYGLTTLSLAQVAYHSSQNSSPFPVSLPFLYDLKNVVVNVVVLVDFNSMLVDFNSDIYPVLLSQVNQAAAGH